MNKKIPDINDLFIDACDAIDAIQHHPRCSKEQYKALEDAYYAIIDVKAQHEHAHAGYLFNGGF